MVHNIDMCIVQRIHYRNTATTAANWDIACTSSTLLRLLTNLWVCRDLNCYIQGVFGHFVQLCFVFKKRVQLSIFMLWYLINIEQNRHIFDAYLLFVRTKITLNEPIVHWCLCQRLFWICITATEYLMSNLNAICASKLFLYRLLWICIMVMQYLKVKLECKSWAKDVFGSFWGGVSWKYINVPSDNVYYN